MLTPAYKLTIGKKTVDSAKEPQASTLVELIVSLDLERSADSVTVVLGQVGGQLTPALRDKAAIELGYADGGALTQVIAAEVVSVEPNLNTERIVGFTAAETLLRSYINETFEDRTAGAIVRDLAGRVKVSVASAEDGISFPFYVIDGRRSFLRHMRDLADLSGFDLYFNNQGRLVFEKFAKPKSLHVLEHAKDMLEVRLTRSIPIAATVQAWGESPADRKGEGASAWLTKNFGGSKGVAGSGKPVLLLERPTLRTRTAANTAALADEARIQHSTVQGRLLSVGRPEVKLGDAIQVRAVPDGSLNKTFQVRAVTHRLTKRGGFTTEIGFRGI
jgi:phage protein D